jgi:two-component system response regulator CpxR
VLEFHGIRLDTGAMRASIDDATIPLTGAELRVLEGLLREAGKVASRDALTQFALGRKRTAYDRALDTHISNLRQKLGGDEAPVEIRNVRGAGYALLPRDGAS